VAGGDAGGTRRESALHFLLKFGSKEPSGFQARFSREHEETDPAAERADLMSKGRSCHGKEGNSIIS